MAILISVVVACIVFYGVQLKGQWVTFWLTYLVTLSCGVGEPALCILVFRKQQLSWASPASLLLWACTEGLQTDPMRSASYCTYLRMTHSRAAVSLMASAAGGAASLRRSDAGLKKVCCDVQCWRTLWRPSRPTWTSPMQ